MSERPQIRVFSVDDHPLLREGIAALVRNQPDMELIAEASSGSEAIKQFQTHQPDVTLMDLRLPDISGIDAMIAIRGEFPEARIIVLTTFEGDIEIQRALQAGARGYLLKHSSQRADGCNSPGTHRQKIIPSCSRIQLAEHSSAMKR